MDGNIPIVATVLGGYCYYIYASYGLSYGYICDHVPDSSYNIIKGWEGIM